MLIKTIRPTKSNKSKKRKRRRRADRWCSFLLERDLKHIKGPTVRLHLSESSPRIEHVCQGKKTTTCINTMVHQYCRRQFISINLCTAQKSSPSATTPADCYCLYTLTTLTYVPREISEVQRRSNSFQNHALGNTIGTTSSSRIFSFLVASRFSCGRYTPWGSRPQLFLRTSRQSPTMSLFFSNPLDIATFLRVGYRQSASEREGERQTSQLSDSELVTVN